ncbi:hypothetical protein MHUMG1_00972 [Metarhizium humberi]|uniref:Uncharacterized protein n=2 Tax=Metarhizium TaxID=5529 RepID=A0A9P8MKF5_9HYPO|nr:hypothetical protein MHUMG1_00972 [Metarhizium humberi]
MAYVPSPISLFASLPSHTLSERPYPNINVVHIVSKTKVNQKITNSDSLSNHSVIMQLKNVMLAAAVTFVDAQRPKDQSICDYYTTVLLKTNNATNQATLLTLLVNTVVIGNYTMPNHNAVPGILAPGEIDGKKVNLAPYFNGDLASTNTGGKMGESVNFLDGGGAAPLKENKPANDNTSHQYFLLTHLYEFFGSLTGCSMQGMAGFDAYNGQASMAEVHKFMGLGKPEMDYFVTQVGLAAASFGVAKDDISAIADSLNSVFNVACGPPTTVVKAQGPQLQSICIDQSTCPKAAEDPMCDMYPAAVKPGNATGTMMPSGSMSATGTASGTNMPSGTGSAVPTAAAAVNGYSVVAVVAGLAAFFV